MQETQKDQAISEVRRSARKALARLSRTFSEWESLISGLKADIADHKKTADQLRDEMRLLPRKEDVEQLNSRINELTESVDKQRRLTDETADNRDNWKEESARLQEQLQKKNKEISRLEIELRRSLKQAEESKEAEIAVLSERLNAENTRFRDRLEQIDRLRAELREQHEQKAALERKVDDLLMQLVNKEPESKSSLIDESEHEALRKELEETKEKLSKLAKIEEDYWEAEKKVHELKKSAESREVANQALKHSVDSLREYKVDAKHRIEKLQRRLEETKAQAQEATAQIEEARVQAKMAEARQAQARAQQAQQAQKSETELSDTMRLSAAASQDVRLRVQNQELRDKLVAQRKQLDDLETQKNAETERLAELEASNNAQKALIGELQKDVDEFTRFKASQRRKDLELSQLKAEIQSKQETIDSLQAEILNIDRTMSKGPEQISGLASTQAYKLDQGQIAGQQDGKDDAAMIEGLQKQLAEKEASISSLQNTVADLRSRFQNLANRDKVGNKTVPMLKVLERKPAEASDSGKSKPDDKGPDIAATVMMRRPDSE